MSVISSLKSKTQITSVDVGAFICPLVVNRNYVTAHIGDYSGNVLELSRLIHKLNVELTGSARHKKSSADNSREDSNVDITAREKAYRLLTLKYPQLKNVEDTTLDDLEEIEEKEYFEFPPVDSDEDEKADSVSEEEKQ